MDKVLFVVDRKDLDYQTMAEYDRFEKGSANSNTSTAVLKRQLEDPNCRIIITTIQKLSTFVRGNKDHAICDDHVVIIFDECHRSQLGDMHAAITKAFNKYHLFGFTGTPIFAENSGSGRPTMRTTEQAFGDKLHTYTIVDAITDKNVLPFRIDYANTVKAREFEDKQVSAIDTERALRAPERIREIAKYILEHFDQKTMRNKSYTLKDRRVRGFNAIFATASIDAARAYYNQFQLLQEDLEPDRRLKVATIYSYAPNAAVGDVIDEENFDTSDLDDDARSFLEDAIQDYNGIFGTSFDTSASKFENYYRDLSKRMKEREVDLVIVVNMFLTGFDATTLNTLFVDKNLKSHGLIQAFSRTNRILNSVKTFGNIVSFRNLEDETNAALELFGNKDARGIVLLKPYSEYYRDYENKVRELLEEFPLGEVIASESKKKEFVNAFGAILRLVNILHSFDDFAGHELLDDRQVQDYQSIYLDLYAEFKRGAAADRESINDDVLFEIELIKQVEINVDYILMLVEKYQKEHGNGEDTEVRATIGRALDSSPSLRSKRDLVEAFIDSISLKNPVDQQWKDYVARRRREDLDVIIAEENLREDLARAFIDGAFRDGQLHTAGTDITRIMPPVSRFAPSGGHSERKKRIVEKLEAYFERFFGLGGGEE